MSPSPPWSRRTEVAVTTAFWVFLTGLLLVRGVLSPRGPVGLGPYAVARILSEYAAWVVLTPVVFALAQRFPLERGHAVRRLAGFVVFGLAVAAAIELARSALVQGLIDGGALPERLARRGRLRLTPLESVTRLQFVDEFVIYAGVLAAGFARGFAARAVERETESARLSAQAAQLEAERARLEGQLTDARLSALRMQLNPHFLFNALNAVSAYVERDPERAQTMLAQLGGLLRRVLDGDARPEVPLADELALLRDYLAIQQARFGDGLVVEEAVESGVLCALVPPLVLQPLAENAVEHGVSRLAGTPGRIAVAARRETGPGGDERLVLTVTDNGPGGAPPSPRDGGGVGLSNTRDRLATLHGHAATLTLADGPGGGAVATVTLPYRTLRAPSHA